MKITRHDEFRARRYDPGISSARRPSKKRHLRIPPFVPYLIAVILVFAGTVLASRLDQLQIKEVEVVGARSEDRERLGSVVEKELMGTYFLLYPKRNLLLISDSRIMSALEIAAPRLETVAVERNDLRNLVVVVKERSPVAIACTTTNKNCHFVDHNGLLFARAPNISGDLFLGIVLSEDRIAVERHVVDTGLFKKLIETRNIIDDVLRDMPYQARVGKLIVGEGESAPRFAYEISVADPTIDPWSVLVSSDLDVRELAGRINPAIKTLAQDARKAGAKKLEYVDFRFGNRVFYKYR